ncbi:MAG TPA: MFS transporter [Pseudonocardiaceae bacterium]|nr:MFS transporter [Pseudonocardiaceae bacterium]
MGVLRDRRFRRLLVGQVVSSVAVSALFLALGIWAKDLTHSNALAGCVFLALGVPTLLSPLAGHLIDRVRRRKPLLIITNAGLGAVVLTLLAVHGRPQLWLIYAVAAAAGLATDVLGSSRSALLKDMMSDDDLGPANALLQTLSQGTRLLSPLFGAGMYTLLGGHGLAIVVASLFGVASLALSAVHVTESEPEPHTGLRLRTELMAGFRHVRSVPLLSQLAVVGALAFGVVGLFETVGFAIVDQGLHRTPSFYGVIDTVQGVGAVAGGIVSARIMRRWGEGRTVGIGLAMIGIGAAAMIAPAMAPVLTGTVVLGFGVPLFVVGWSTGLQRYTPPRLQGRVNAAANLMLSGPQTASIGLGATLIAIVDYRILLLVIFAGMLVSGAILLIKPAATTTNTHVAAPTIASAA